MTTRVLPALREGFVMRAPTDADVEAIVAFENLCELAEMGEIEATVDETRVFFSSPGVNVADDVRIILDPDGRIVAYVDVYDAYRPVTPWVGYHVHPEVADTEIGAVIFAWAEERARRAIARVEPDVRVAMRAGCSTGYTPYSRILEAAGMTPIRHHYHMMIEFDGPTPAPEWPEGITVRTFRAGEERAVLQALRDSFQDHFGWVDQPFEQHFTGWWYFWSHSSEFDPSLWFLAMAGDQIAGISLCTPKYSDDEGCGWVATLGVSRPYRRQGLGMALLRHSFVELAARGKKRVGLGVDASSLTGATRLYERAGMHIHQRFDSYEKELRPGRDITRQRLD